MVHEEGEGDRHGEGGVAKGYNRMARPQERWSDIEDIGSWS